MKNSIFIIIALICLDITQGHARKTQKSYSVTQLCEKPRIFHLDNLLSSAECEYIIRLATPKLERSPVLGENANENVIHSGRTSTGAFITTGSDKILRRIEKKIEEITKIPTENGEDFYVIHYDVGQEFRPHFDYFGGQSKAEIEALSCGGQRVASVVIYLYNTEEGGETIFPYANLSVVPIMGSAILFYNTLPNGSVDPMSLHGGTPVKKGEKWVMTKWLRASSRKN